MDNKEISKLAEDFPRIKRCNHCGKYFLDTDEPETHQSDFCEECRENHRGEEVIEEE